jgi:enoyl-CoA hydratase
MRSPGSASGRCIEMPVVETSRSDSILTVTINRPEVRNAVDAATAAALADAFRSFDADETLDVAVLTGAGGTFCAGADLKADRGGAAQRAERRGRRSHGAHAHAAFEAGDRRHRRPRRSGRPGTGAVVRSAGGGARCHAGGLLPAVWRAADRSGDHPAAAPDRAEPGAGPDPDRARCFGRRSLAHGTGQPAGGIRARIGGALELARMLAGFPQTCMRSDRLSCYEQWGLSTEEAIRNEYRRGLAVLGAAKPWRARGNSRASDVGRDSSPAADVHVGLWRVLEDPRRPGGPPHGLPGY